MSPDLGTAGAPDVLQSEFYGSTIPTGATALSGSVNGNYQTCNECFRVFQDLVDYPDGGGALGKVFFQSGGTLNVSAADGTNGTITGTLNDVTLVEVTIDSSFLSTPVQGGACLHITNQSITAQ
jgi:hypothetical protein